MQAERTVTLSADIRRYLSDMPHPLVTLHRLYQDHEQEAECYHMPAAGDRRVPMRLSASRIWNGWGVVSVYMLEYEGKLRIYSHEEFKRLVQRWATLVKGQATTERDGGLPHYMAAL